MGLVVHGMWHLPRAGIEPVSLALQGGFSTSGPPGKAPFFVVLSEACQVIDCRNVTENWVGRRVFGC